MAARRARLRGWLALLLMACAAPWAMAAPSEYQVKAVFLFNFSQFVEWPSAAFQSPAAPFVIGVLGDDPFGASLDEAVRSESVNQHPLLVKRIRDLGEIADCNILYLGQMDSKRMEEVLAALKGRSILTVSDADGLARNGVMIRFVTESHRVRLKINLGVAKASNLTISSKLLRLADIVDGSDGG
jgi:hypothetical protein